MSEVTVRFVGGPADGLVRQVPAEPDGTPPRRWIMRHPDGTGPVQPGPDHLYERGQPDGLGGWSMRFVRTDAFGVSE
ncbi:hypothetical protein JNW91_10070 [Micromonospora sp. STR1_7]|uniref:Uncharacterized protein n=1 Tax=Micromonospora parastrephiae TaxID=2806101 RepID=A0ABS1XSP2_9ACTN|nr:hypothetical protein [Micromonospora parastrephiae]MBM0232179.1 hypothetical protein [Micromonospora parastrephiae]